MSIHVSLQLDDDAPTVSELREQLSKRFGHDPGDRHRPDTDNPVPKPVLVDAAHRVGILHAADRTKADLQACIPRALSYHTTVDVAPINAGLGHATLAALVDVLDATDLDAAGDDWYLTDAANAAHQAHTCTAAGSGFTVGETLPEAERQRRRITRCSVCGYGAPPTDSHPRQ